MLLFRSESLVSGIQNSGRVTRFRFESPSGLSDQRVQFILFTLAGLPARNRLGMHNVEKTGWFRCIVRGVEKQTIVKLGVRSDTERSY